MTQTIPKRITLVSVLISLLAFFVALSLYVSPAPFLKNVDLSSNGALFLTYMWASRQLAIAFIIGYACIRQSVPMLQISLLAYALMNLQDLVIGLTQSDPGLVFGSLFFGILSLILTALLYLVNKEVKD